MTVDALRRLATWLDDRCNPVLVREVRQSLRGWQFRITFALALAAGVVGTLVLLVVGEGGSTLGLSLFGVISTCLIVSCQVLVPYWAFGSLGAEWEENTFDLLVMSNLRPVQIALGKLLAAQIQTLLFFSSFGPFLVCSFLLRGVGLLEIALLVVAVIVLSTSACVVAIFLSSLARLRWVRMVMMGALGLILVPAAFAPIVGGGTLLLGAGDLFDPEVQMVIGILLSGLCFGSGIVFAATCALLSHPEENRSSVLRAVYAVSLLVLLGWTYGLLRFVGELREFPLGAAMGAVGAAAFAILFATEPERLRRKVRLDVPAARWKALLAAPFLPGGGRGALLLAASHALVLLVAALVVLTDWPMGIGQAPGETIRQMGESLASGWAPEPSPAAAAAATAAPGRVHGVSSNVAALVVAMAYAWIYVGFVSAVGAFFTGRNAALRWLVAVMIPFVAAMGVVLPYVVRFAIDPHAVGYFTHPGNFQSVIVDLSRGDREAIRWSVPVVALGLLAVLVNVPRMVRGVLEVLEASSARREREARLAALESPPAAEIHAGSGA